MIHLDRPLVSLVPPRCLMLEYLNIGGNCCNCLPFGGGCRASGCIGKENVSCKCGNGRCKISFVR